MLQLQLTCVEVLQPTCRGEVESYSFNRNGFSVVTGVLDRIVMVINLGLLPQPGRGCPSFLWY